MIHRKIFSMLLALLLVLAVSCWRGKKTGDVPRLPDTVRTSGKAESIYQGLDRYGFLFVVMTKTGRHFIQLSEFPQKEPPDVSRDGLRIAQYIPSLLLLHAPQTPVYPELEGREYVIMRNDAPLCRGKLEKPLQAGQLVPGSHEWNEWEVSPWDDPPPPLEEVEKKIPLDELWKKSYAFPAAPLSCAAVPKENDYSRVFWARPADAPAPRVLSQEVPKPLYRQLREEAVRRLNESGFAEKVQRYQEEMGGEEFTPSIDVFVWTDEQSSFVEVRAFAGEEECGGGANQTWILWRVSNSQWEELARENSMRNVALIGDFNEDGKYEIVIRDHANYNYIVITFYQIEGLYLKKIMRMEYPSYEAVC